MEKKKSAVKFGVPDLTKGLVANTTEPKVGNNSPIDNSPAGKKARMAKKSRPA